MTGALEYGYVTPALFAIVAGFLLWFWFSRHGASALSRYTDGEFPVDLGFYYSPDKLYRHLDLYGEEGRNSFRLTQLVDLVYPLFYSAAFGSLARDLDVPWVSVLICTFILIAALFDYAEDILLLFILKAYPVRKNTLARLAAGCTFIKASGSYAAILLVAGVVLKGEIFS